MLHDHPIYARSRGAAAQTETCSSHAGHKTRFGPFLERLKSVLADGQLQGYIHWSADDQYLVVPHRDLFSRHVLPKVCRSTNFNAFVRQLNKHGFRKVNEKSCGAQGVKFAHEDFRPDELSRMKIATAKPGGRMGNPTQQSWNSAQRATTGTTFPPTETKFGLENPSIVGEADQSLAEVEGLEPDASFLSPISTVRSRDPGAFVGLPLHSPSLGTLHPLSKAEIPDRETLDPCPPRSHDSFSPTATLVPNSSELMKHEPGSSPDVLSPERLICGLAQRMSQMENTQAHLLLRQQHMQEDSIHMSGLLVGLAEFMVVARGLLPGSIVPNANASRGHSRNINSNVEIISLMPR